MTSSTLVDSVHELAEKCAEQDAKLDKAVKIPYAAYVPRLADIDISQYHDGTIILTDEPLDDEEN